MDVFEQLQEIIAEELNREVSEITLESDFKEDFGADSLDLYQVIVKIEDVFDIEIPDDVAESIVTVGDAVEKINQVLNNN